MFLSRPECEETKALYQQIRGRKCRFFNALLSFAQYSEPKVKPARCEGMYTREQRESFLTKALEAEREAAAVQQPQLKESWLKLAATYRALANASITTPVED